MLRRISTAKRSCPACASNRAFRIGTFKPNAPGSYSSDFDLMDCKCGTIFQSPLPTLEDFDTLYRRHTQFDSPEYQDELKVSSVLEFMTGRLESLTQTHDFRKNLNILEVGAGYAWMCRAASVFLPESFRVAQDVTNELSSQTPWVNQYFVNELEFMPLDEAVKFQIVSMTHVLEHISHPKEFLIKVKKFLSPNGLIFITMPHRPNGPKAKKQTWESWSYHHVPGHLQYFSQGSLESLLEETGLEISYWNAKSEGGQASELHLVHKN